MWGESYLDDRSSELENEANAVAQEHGLDADRVWAVLARLENCVWLLTPPERELRQAIRALGASEALQLFEQEEHLEWLAWRVIWFRSLMSEATPLYTLAELADLTGSFVAHLERNREQLVATGYPRTTFESSSWFD